MKHHTLSAFSLAAFAAFTLACSQSPAGPAAGTGNDPGSANAGPDGSTLKVTAPRSISPATGDVVDDLDPDLVIENAEPLFVEGLALSYVFELFNEDNVLLYRSAPIAQGGNGRTSHEVGVLLKSDEVHTWRARAIFQGQEGPLSESASFRTFDRFGTVCVGSEPDIVACRKAQYGFIPHDELPDFLEKVAHDLNVGGHEHRPYGRLVKTTGNNCHGYSCDIICSGQGNGQRQWDVLIDEDDLQAPVWNRVGDAFPRFCEVVQ